MLLVNLDWLLPTRRDMKRKSRNYDRPVGKMTRVHDFLPSPDEIVVPERTIKVTLRLTEETLNFFKREAKKHHTKYQTMIRSLLGRYVEKYS